MPRRVTPRGHRHDQQVIDAVYASIRQRCRDEALAAESDEEESGEVESGEEDSGEAEGSAAC